MCVCVDGGLKVRVLWKRVCMRLQEEKLVCPKFHRFPAVPSEDASFVPGTEPTVSLESEDEFISLSPFSQNKMFLRRIF